jgi:hypothetical protein
MKKKVALLCVLFISCQVAGFGQKTVDRLFNEYSKLKDVNRVDLGSISVKMAGLFADTFGLEGEVIRELVVLSSGQSPAMIRLKGQINKSDVDKLISEHGR